MEKFTKIKKNELKREENEDLFKSDEMSIIKFDDKNIITSLDQVVILPYLKDEGYFLLKYEKLPAFKFKYKDKSEYNDQDYYLNIIRSDYDDKLTPNQNIRKVLYEKTGIVLNQMYPIEIDKVLFKQENNVGQYHICLLELKYNDFKQSSLKTTDDIDDNKVVKINLGDIDNIKTFDISTDYMLLKLKYDYKI